MMPLQLTQVAQSVVSDFLTSPLNSASPTLDANVILDNLILAIREDMRNRFDLQYWSTSLFFFFTNFDLCSDTSEVALEDNKISGKFYLVQIVGNPSNEIACKWMYTSQAQGKYAINVNQFNANQSMKKKMSARKCSQKDIY